MSDKVGKIAEVQREKSLVILNQGFPAGSDDKEYACNAGDLGSIPGPGKAPIEENGNPFQYSCWRIPWTEDPGRLQSMGSQKSQP